MVPEPAEYKLTFFDRHGPDGLSILRFAAYSILIFGATAGAITLRVGFRWWVLPVSILFGGLGGGAGWLFAEAVGNGWKQIAVSGASTPYVEQYSMQQALVMQGRVDEALASFETIIAEQPELVAPRVKAAELYSRKRGDHRRAAELFRAALQSPLITASEDTQVTHRLVDLLTGPLGDPGRALVELRRLIDRHPGTAAAEHARRGLAELKARFNDR